MNWNVFIPYVLGWALYRWEKKEFKLFSYLKEVLVFGLFIYLVNLLGNFVFKKLNISFSISNYIPETVQFWIGGIIFFTLVCAFSVKGWRNFNAQKGSRGSNE